VSTNLPHPASPELATAKEAPGDADPDAVATGSDWVLLGFPGADAPYGDPVDPYNVFERTVAQHRSFSHYLDLGLA
jgi:hypothetical protein